jgi:valyl-tRNA synthetase
MPIMQDDYVVMEFGTSAVKITPAHDPKNFTLGRRRYLEFINILNDNGKINANTRVIKDKSDLMCGILFGTT